MSRMLSVARVVLGFCILCVGALVMLAVAIPTLGLARRFYSEVIGRWIGVLILRTFGVRFRVHGRPQRAATQTIYVSNHSSTLDLFLLIALALPRTRFFLSGFLRKMAPIGIIGTLIRIFWTVPQELPNRRRQIFKRADRILRRTGDSAYLSPEGMRVTSGEIGWFNKGAFHLATSLHAPIVPIYFAIPVEMDPGRGLQAQAGTADIYFLPPIATSNWELTDLAKHRDAVRDLFVHVHDSMRSTHRLPTDAVIELEEHAHEEAMA
jgi:1-acyl-sn-glycerol-3-phosphate acyltransferase